MNAALAYDPFSPEAMADPYPLYREMRAAGAFHPLPQYHGFALPRFAEVWQVLEDLESFSVAEGPVFAKERVSRPAEPSRLGTADRSATFAAWDPPLHTRIRQLLGGPLRRSRIRALEPELRRLARERLDALAPEGGFDVVSDYAGPVSAMIACRVVGFPAERGPALVSIIRRSALRDPEASGLTPDGANANAELGAFAFEQIARRRELGGADAEPTSVMERLLTEELDGAPLDAAEIATHLVTLIVGGSETVPKLVAGGLRELWRASDQRAQLVRDPGLAPGAFEEVIRHQGVLQSIGRTALRDVEIGGRRIERGQRLFLLLQSANRDEREFPDGERFDIHRAAPRHVGLGHGQHHCIGSHVARLEGQVLLCELLARFPDYEVDESGAWRPPSEFQLGYSALPIRF